ncbi:LOW QUALITY PROTEIN: topoisomerase I binding, arginine/serine-rich a [Neoarius graeffei]|uniref:LOW QUALITY PROTEIN: topoisomerase I binding, arginine/serine-rich a n=1 Tax=Neoarius graeffei TaxID=443677 RepID=UPI00298C9AEF|nr:LOW QUALITY PROTEIN: topoisomerase I binding, arginine/serine-rich a [Neoarius graeffei]
MMMSSTEPDIDLQKVCAAAEMLGRESSPESKCPICLDSFTNMSYTDRCFHRFCFCCILEWGKNKAECPLCKQPFSAVYHSVRSENDFKLYKLRPSEKGSFGTVQGRRFRYRTTRVHESSTVTRIQLSAHQQEVMSFRRRLYQHGVWVRGVRDGGRFRDTSAEFFRSNPACIHRLLPWLYREMEVLFGSRQSHGAVVAGVISSLITRYDMGSEAFLWKLHPFLSSRTRHFLHEFQSFAKSPFNMDAAKSPFNMDAYDHHAVYNCPAPSQFSHVSDNFPGLSSTPSSFDDEIPGPSYSTASNSVFTVTISESDRDSASEEEKTVRVKASASANINVRNARVDEDNQSSDGDCVITGFIKPTAQRTPELILLSSDSEASVQEEPEPSTSSQSDTRQLTNQRSWNTDHILSHSSTKHNSKRRDRERYRDRERDYSSHSHRRCSRSLSYKDRRKSKATNDTSLSHTYARTCDRRHTPQRSRTRSRSRTHSHTSSRTHSFSRSRTHARSGSRTRVAYRGHSERLSVSPSPLSHRKSSRDKPHGKRKHKSQHEERRRSKENHRHHPKKKRRRSSSMEVGDERRKHHRKKKKHKRDRKNRSKRMGRSSGASSPVVITIHTDTESADKATPPRDAATTNSEPVNPSHGTNTLSDLSKLHSS